jgi:hypothetical protein
MSDQISTPPGADVTRITASLPTVDMEITRHDDAVAGAEAVTITLRARPGFDAMAQALLPSAMMMPGLNPFMGPMAALTSAGASQGANPSSDPLGMTAAMGQWQKMVEQAWAPVLESWGAMMGGAMPTLGTGLGKNPFADMMAQMAGVPLCSAGAKRKE